MAVNRFYKKGILEFFTAKHAYHILIEDIEIDKVMKETHYVDDYFTPRYHYNISFHLSKNENDKFIYNIIYERRYVCNIIVDNVTMTNKLKDYIMFTPCLMDFYHISDKKYEGKFLSVTSVPKFSTEVNI